MSETEKGCARLFWQFWMEVGPDCALTELPKWGDTVAIMVPSGGDDMNKRAAPSLAKLAATQLAETLLIAMGHEPAQRLAGTLIGVKDFVVNVEIKPR